MADAQFLSFNDTARSIADFIEVATHTVLYVRHVYPANLFVRRKKYDTPVYQSRHPRLNEYINGAIKAVYEELLLGSVDKVVLVIKDDKDVALERFIFAIHNMIQVESFNKETGVEGGITAQSLSQYFRSFLVKLNMIESSLGDLELDDKLTFAILLELEDDKAPTAAPENDVPPWMPAVPQHTTAGQSQKASLRVLRSVDTGVINLSLVVQESEAKKVHMQSLLNEETGREAPQAPAETKLLSSPSSTSVSLPSAASRPS